MDKEIKEITNKHDKGYKRIFSRNRNFLYFLNKYIKSKEVAGWVDNIDKDDLVWINTELIDDKFKERDSDIIYRMKFKGKEIIFYVMLELQSTVDFSIPFRLLTYMTLILKYVFENTPKNEREAKGYRLPAVVPVILYNGADNWTAVRTFKEYSQDYEKFEEYIINFKYYLFDVNRAADAAESSIKQIMDIILMLDKEKNRENMKQAVNTASAYFKDMNDEDKEDLRDWIWHVWLSHITDEQKKDELMKNFEKGEVSDMVSGLSIGFEKERLIGIEEGREEANIVTAEKMILKNKPLAEIIEFSGLTEKAIRQLAKKLSKEMISQ